MLNPIRWWRIRRTRRYRAVGSASPLWALQHTVLLPKVEKPAERPLMTVVGELRGNGGRR
ncbi:hypothetical protein [Micromonospora sp. HUAS LYJ1]|uniref:hypothetical protein n=1 Tax=Micromonospora sp. HUAS LYJ1 TaxID=3061626 RepID=UPI002671B813|nr:hypothetical protein [Micromonospora sp. HUAS LYJ1]WKU07161.1 hypothetical protein Q2K16_08955 [Micromonospora sp. HUAS LYJ1]